MLLSSGFIYVCDDCERVYDEEMCEPRSRLQLHDRRADVYCWFWCNITSLLKNCFVGRNGSSAFVAQQDLGSWGLFGRFRGDAVRSAETAQLLFLDDSRCVVYAASWWLDIKDFYLLILCFVIFVNVIY